MKAPSLLIFDIDETLVQPRGYTNIFDLKQGIYDDKLLTDFLKNSEYQIGIASFNTDTGPARIGGRRLGRAILDIYHSSGNSSFSVPDEFIEAWIYPTLDEIFQYRKNAHIQNIINAYVKKYNCNPPNVYFFDDQIENVYEANKNGVIAFWCNVGVTRENINNFMRIGNRVQFCTFGILENLRELGDFNSLLRRQMGNTKQGQNVYNMYLPIENEYATNWYLRFKEILDTTGTRVSILNSDFKGRSVL